MMEPEKRLRFLIENDLFQLCRPLTASEFVRFCKDRDVDVDESRLETLERTGFFYPLARVRFVKLIRKIEYVDEGRAYRDLGTLQENEIWPGATREEYAHFWFRRDYALSWLNEGYLWDPATRPFEPWRAFIDAEGDQVVQTYYSPFQILPLSSYVTSMTCRVPFDVVHEWSEKDWQAHVVEMKRVASMLVEGREEGQREKIAFICHAISNRYWPHTQGDRRTIAVSGGLSRDWKWHEYARGFDAKAHLTLLGVEASLLRHMHLTTQFDAQHDDPLRDWYDLITYVALNQKQRLKGKALYAQTVYAMEQMLRLFYRDVTEEELHRPDEDHQWKRDDLYGKGVTADELRHLEFLTNRFHLNPRPKAILVVEGATEETAFVQIIERVLGHRLTVLGIEIRKLGGVGEFEGRRMDRLGALERFIEEYHYRQTIVFIVLDDEGNVADLRQRLVEARSKYFPRRTMTRPDHFVVFKPNFEFGNFDDDELATAMTAVAKGTATFSPADVAAARANKRGNALAAVYRERTGHSLSKPAMGLALVDRIAANIGSEFDAQGNARRPVVVALDRLVNGAALNHQPFTVDTWEQNQLSGYFGDVLPAKE
jgi:hypothetical protein